MSSYQSKGVRYGKHSKKFLREYGGLSFLDRLNEALLTLSQDDIRRATRYESNETITLAGLPLSFIGSGVFRSSFRLGNLVIKFPRGESVKDNVTEWEVYQEAVKIGMHRNLAACIALLDGWPYGPVTLYEFVPGHETWGKGGMELRLTKRFSSRGSSISAHDLHGGNVRGRKVIDYGLFDGKREEVARTMKEVSPSRKYLIKEEPAW